MIPGSMVAFVPLLLGLFAAQPGVMSRAFRTTSVVALNVAHAVRAPGGTLGARLAAVARGTRDYVAGRFGEG